MQQFDRIDIVNAQHLPCSGASRRSNGSRSCNPCIVFNFIHADQLWLTSIDCGGAQHTEGEGGIERAVATGREVIVRKMALDGGVKIGKARKVTYEESTGDVTLEIWPQVRDGDNVQLSKSADAIMILKQDGKMVTKGATQTKIIPKGNEDPLATPGR